MNLLKVSLLSVAANMFVAALTLLPANAKAADDFVARPAGAASSERHGYDRRDSVTGTVSEPSNRKAIASSEAGAPKEVTYGELLRSTFGPRWNDSFDAIREANLQSDLPAGAGIDQSSSVLADIDVRNDGARGRLAENVLGAFLVSAGSALVLLALFGRLLLFQRAAPAPDHPAPPRLPYLGSALGEPIHANPQSNEDDSSERDRYGIPFSAVEVRRSAAGGAGSLAVKPLTPSRTLALDDRHNSRPEPAV